MEELSVLIEFYKKRVERNPQLLSSHAIYSEYLILSNRFDEAILISLKSLLVSSWFIRSQIDLGLSYLLKGDYKSSEIELKHALKIDPENDFSFLLLALLYYKLGVYDLSIEYLKEGFDYNPENRYIRKLYKIITHKELPYTSFYKEIEEKVLNGFIDSEEMLKIKLEKNGKKPYELLYAYALKNENRLLEAIETIERILIYNPYYPNALYTLGKFYEMSGNRRKKDECWEKCVEVNPLMGKIKNLVKNYENIHFEVNDLNELESLYDKIIDKTFDDLVKEEIELERIEDKAIKKEEFIELPQEEKVEKEEVLEEINKEELIEKEKIEEPLMEEKKPFEEEKELEEIEKNSDYYKKLGDEYLKKGMYKEAIEMFTKALKLSKEKS